MERYTSLFEGDAYAADMLEAVFVPRKEVESILNLLRNSKQEIFNKKLQNEQLCKQLSGILKNYKILFVDIREENEDNFFKKGQFNQISDIISILCFSGINYIIKDDRYFELFIKKIQVLIGHELVHRMQYIQRALENLSYKTGESFKKYLSDPDEVMSYAWQAVEELRFRFGDDNEIISLIKTESPIKYRVSFALTIYKTEFKIDEKPMKLLYKYMYMYLDSNEAI